MDSLHLHLFISRHFYLKDHLVTHSSEKPFSYSQCGKSFAKKGQLENHLVTHSSESLLSALCGKSFAKKGQLENHLVTHSSEKPFSCSQCGKSFTQKGQLGNDMLIHTGKSLSTVLSVDSLHLHLFI